MLKKIQNATEVTIELDDFIKDFTHCFTGECRVNILPQLYKINLMSSSTADLGVLLTMVLNVMRQQLYIHRGMVMLYEHCSETIFIHDCFGLTEQEKARGIYTPGEGITGKVIETGKAIIVSHLCDNKDFLNRTGVHFSPETSNDSFFCVPIMRGQKVLGAICAERSYRNQQLLKQDVQVLAVIASMMAPLVELHLVDNIAKLQLENENRRLKNELKKCFKPSCIIGHSKPMRALYAMIHKVAATKATVLLLGESGVGKELVANAIHFNSPYSKGPFIKANCAALPESLAESALLGHEKGSFTGASGMHQGFFEQADHGSIFLDEIGELSLPMQAKLLRVLQERNFQRVGGSKVVQVDIRIVAATNRDLLEMVQQGTFREDLYYRLNVFPIDIPPLRARGSDVITLAEFFSANFAKDSGIDIHSFSTGALHMLMNYHWPGNVRELENIIERAVILADDGIIHSHHLPLSLSLQSSPDERQSRLGGSGLEAQIKALEYNMIVDALQSNVGNIGEAAKALGLTRRMLSLRMERFSINYKTFR